MRPCIFSVKQHVKLTHSSNLTSFSIKKETVPWYLTAAAPVRDGSGWILSAACESYERGLGKLRPRSPDQSNCKHCLICKLNPENSGLGSLHRGYLWLLFTRIAAGMKICWVLLQLTAPLHSPILFPRTMESIEVFVARNLIKQKQLPILIGSDYPWKLLAPAVSEGVGHRVLHRRAEDTEDT